MSAIGCRCGASWTGMRVEHCPECHETFTGTISGDKHRTGKHHLSTGPDRRRCLSADEMRDKGMTQNKRGQWGSGGVSPWSQCDERCHDANLETCPKCDTLDWSLMCDSCRSYAAEDAGR